MSNRTFLAFLGTGGYQPCTYKYEDKAEKSKYIQIALLKIFCSDFDENDKIRIFVTKRARSVHWEPADGSDGLKKEIDALGMRADVKAVDIPDGESETKLWDIFQAVFDEIDENSSIIFDMTHAYRSLPMFGMTVINYAHYLKNTTLKGIYYGAYEAGGQETGVAPIFDLTPAFDLMTWTTAANSFTKYGVTEELCKRIEWNQQQIASATNLSKSIKDMEITLNYMRGNKIISGEVFDNCRNSIGEYKNSESVKNIPPLSPILDKVDEKIIEFQLNTPLNFVYAVQWYVDHSMPAEALSMLKEGTVTYLLKNNGLDYTNKDLRGVLGERLAFVENRSNGRVVKFDYELSPKRKACKTDIENVMSSEEANNLKSVIESMNFCRNDIDHCGFDKNNSAEDIDKKIASAAKKLHKIFGLKYPLKHNTVSTNSFPKEKKEIIRPASEPSEKSGLPANTGKNEIQKAAKQSTGCAVVLFVIAAALGLSVFSIAMFL